MSVRCFGGVLEHPEGSHAWRTFGLNTPRRGKGWIKADEFGGWTCSVEQGHYGHTARKSTWLYIVDTYLPALPIGASSGKRLDEGFHSKEEAREARMAPGWQPRKRLSRSERIDTPMAFRDLLLDMAGSVGEAHAQTA